MEFEKFINKKLCELDTDETVYGPYVLGILADEDNPREALQDLLTDIVANGESELDRIINEILEKWETANSQSSTKDAVSISTEDDVNEKLSKLLESNIRTNVVQRNHTDEEIRIRSKILQDYGQLSDHEEDDDDRGGDGSGSGAGGAPGGAADDPDLVKNTNLLDVQQLKKERRDQAKLESQMKKDKDKEDREKQKKLREQKKDKRKTVKQERRR